MKGITQIELEDIISQWHDFARTKDYKFRLVNQIVYNAYFPQHAAAIIAKSELKVIRDHER